MRKKTKFNPELLKEELNRFKLLETYDFYHEEKEAPEYEKPLLLGRELEEADEVPSDLEPADSEAAANNIAADLGVDPNAEGGEDTGDAADVAPEGDMSEPEPETEEPAIEEPASDEVEVDVTSIVKGSEEAKVAADNASQNSEMLLQKLNDLEARIANMAQVSAKIEELENEIIKRNPTPVEKLEMRSLSSFPYSQKLTDYWSDKEGAYDVMNNKPKEYVLTQDDVDADFSEPQIKKSFGVKPEDFEEEDI
jgi:hypothetical protein